MFLVGIAGGSGSGKTTFTNKVLQRVLRDDSTAQVAILHQDSYYLASPPNHLRVHGEPNFDHPDAFDWALLKDHLRRLKRGERVEVPIYDYTSSRRLKETNPVGPCHAILMEGIYTLWDAEIRDFLISGSISTSRPISALSEGSIAMSVNAEERWTASFASTTIRSDRCITNTWNPHVSMPISWSARKPTSRPMCWPRAYRVWWRRPR